MSRYIDADKAVRLLRGRLIETANNNCGFKCDAGSIYQDAGERIPRWIDEIPTADVVPVVRCKDCKWKMVTMLKENYCHRKEDIVKNDYFCADGERSEE